MSDFQEIKNLIQDQGQAWAEFKTANNARLKNLEDFTFEIAKKTNRPGFAISAGSSEDTEHKDAFMNYLRTGRESDLESKAMLTGSSPDGGYAVPKQIDSEVTKALVELSPMRQVARVVQVDSGDFTMLHSTGGTGYSWVGETDSRPQTNTPKLMEINPPVGEIYSMPGVTQRLLDDACFDLEQWLIDEVTEAIGAGEGDAFMNGTGISKPRGLLTYNTDSAADATRDNDKLQYVPSGASGAFAASNPADKLVTLVHSLKPRYRMGAAWMLNTNTLEQVRSMKDGQGNYIWRSGVESGQPNSLLGYPVYEDENMPDISANSLSIAFGNFQRGYVVVDRSTTLLRDPYTAKPNVLFYTVRRVGGTVRDFRAIKLMKFAAS